ncbi:DUF1700 domain-containing protein [Silvanigrella sp.]|jgi:uncharacterized membrane protein|uniref:DUF1700 domain-containing protein n=1 Tax=Silvanigrella sp. TaxID=2024976 RepID=UPI0037C91444|nr:DUF1700 domain-containing protein [Silvanigrellaceae bacterium]
MNKTIFLQKLKNSLSFMSDAEKEEILRDYEEHFYAAKESGKTEQEVIQSLGDPCIIAKSFSSEKIIHKINSNTFVPKKLLPALQSYFLVTGVGFFNLVFFGIPYFIVSIFGLFIWISSFSFTFFNFLHFVECMLSCINICNTNFLSSGLFHLGNFFLGILLLNICYFITNKLLKIFIKHVQFSLKISKINSESLK